MKRFFFVALCASVIFTLGADSQDAELVAREKAESVLWCQLQDGLSKGEYQPQNARELYSKNGYE